MAKLVSFFLLYLLTASAYSPATKVEADDLTPRAKLRHESQALRRPFTLRKLLQGNCPDIGCVNDYTCPKGCYCGDDNMCVENEQDCPEIGCPDDSTCPRGCFCDTNNLCAYTERGI